MAEFVVITGMSGAGRSQASNVLEDLGWFVIDNLPLPLVAKVAELADVPGAKVDRVVLVVGRNAPEELGADGQLDGVIDQLRSSGSRVRVVFLDANDETLIRRYEGSRRRHPLAEQEGIAVGIQRERRALEPVKARADVVVDTSTTNVHELRDRVASLFEGVAQQGMAVTIVSFGFKHGLPSDVDLVFDLRFLPNPHWVDELRPFTGLDQPVREYVLLNEHALSFVAKLEDLLAELLPQYAKEGKAYLSIGVGCTGGQHRAVAIGEELGRRLTVLGYPPMVRHRDLHKR